MRRAPAILLVIPLLLALACGEQAADVEKARPEIEAMLLQYLPRLGEVYAENDASRVEGLAADREIAAIEKRLRDIRLEGRTLAPTFRSMTI